MTTEDRALEHLIEAWAAALTEPSSADHLLDLELHAVQTGCAGLRLLRAPHDPQAQWLLRAAAIRALHGVESPLLDTLAHLTGWSGHRARRVIARHAPDLCERHLLDNPLAPDLPHTLLAVLCGGAPGAARPIHPACEPDALTATLPQDPGIATVLIGCAQRAERVVAERAGGGGRRAFVAQGELCAATLAAWIWWARCHRADLLFTQSGGFELTPNQLQGLVDRCVLSHAASDCTIALWGDVMFPPTESPTGRPAVLELPTSGADAGDPLSKRNANRGDGLALRKPTVALGELVLSESVQEQIEQVIARAQAGERAVILLHGPPGTGKTHTAEAIAHALDRPIADLVDGEVRDSLFGGQERAIRTLFTRAQTDRLVLRIDEADRWLGRRSHAQHQPIQCSETATLLLALEHFTGIAVLTTNRVQSLDPALFRRLDQVIALDMPEPLDRLYLWGRHLPESLHHGPTLAVLAALPLTGGDIHAVLRQLGPEPTLVSVVAAARQRAEQRDLLGAC